MESILNSIKKLLGPTEEQTHFDTDIIIHINSAFSRLLLLGIGPSEGFYIEDDLSVWTDFIPDDHPKFQMVKTYVYERVKLRFDPPSNSAVLKAMQEDIAELEWCLNVAAETK